MLVVALPAVEQPQLPPLHAVNPKEIYCAGRTALVLPVDGAPLVFSTGYAHDVTLSLTGSDGKSIDLPATADAAQGGYVVDTAALHTAALGDSVHASLQGYWGFERYHGPGFVLMNAHAKSWELAAGDEDALVVGRQDTVHLQADSVSCVDGIMLKDPAGKELKAEWKTVKPNELEVKLPLQEAKPGAMTLLVTQFGVSQPQPISIQTFAEAGHFDGFDIHAGDAQGMLKGSRLDEVASLSLKNVVFVPGELSTRNGSDELPMVAQDAQAAAGLKQERSIAAKVTLKDGRVLPLVASVDAPRPRVTLIGKSAQPSPSSKNSNIQLADPGELPQDATLTFAVRTQWPAVFSRDENIEVATSDESSATVLSFANGGITLENAQVAVATLNPAKAFGASAFGPLQFRVVAKGIAGDWQPLGNLVRLPVLKDLTCPSTPELACKLSGSNLFLVDSVSSDPGFAHPVQVPDGFLGSALPVPHPAAGPLYVKLRDDPSVINPTTLETQQLPPSPNDLARARAVQAAPATGAPAALPEPPAPPPPATPPADNARPPPQSSVAEVSARRSFRYLLAGASRLRQSDGDGLLAARHLFAGPAAAQGPGLHLLHRLLDLLAARLAVFARHDRLPRCLKRTLQKCAGGGIGVCRARVSAPAHLGGCSPTPWGDSPGETPPLKNAQRHARGHRRAEFLACFQVLPGDLLGPQNFFRRLRMSADDEGIGDGPQAPAGRDAFDLLRGIAAVAAGADQCRVGPAIEPVERRIVSAVEEILHFSRHRGQILRGRENIAVRAQHIGRPRILRAQQGHLQGGLAAGAGSRGLRHLQRAAGHGVVHDQQRLHRHRVKLSQKAVFRGPERGLCPTRGDDAFRR